MTTSYIFNGHYQGGPIIILAPGATMKHFDEAHILVKKLKSNVSKIISLDLPGHGGSQLLDSNPISYHDAFHDLIDTMNNALKRVRKKNQITKVGFIGFSLSGLFAMRIKEPPFHFAIYMGCGTTFDESNLRKIRWFFSVNTYKQSKLLRNIKRDHGPNWEVMLDMINSWFADDSDMIKIPLKKIVVPSLFILTENDQAWQRNSIDVDGLLSILNVSGDHFSYFTPIVIDSYKEKMIKFIEKHSSVGKI